MHVFLKINNAQVENNVAQRNKPSVITVPVGIGPVNCLESACDLAVLPPGMKGL